MERINAWLLAISLLALALNACGPTGVEPPSGPTGLPGDVETKVKEALSARTGVPVGEIQVVEAEQREWSDACLGLAEEGEVCAEVITPGWEITLRAGGETYVLHTDEDADAIRMEG